MEKAQNNRQKVIIIIIIKRKNIRCENSKEQEKRKELVIKTFCW